MPQHSKQDLLSIKEWMSKEPYLPQDLDDKMLIWFLHSCYFSLEATKRCINRFCITRAQMPEVYISRDPLSDNIRNMLDHIVLGIYEFDGKDVVIHKLDDPTLDNFNFYDYLKTLTIQGDTWIKYHPNLPDGHYIVIDMSCFSFKLVSKINIMYLRDFILYLLEGMPVRVKKVIGINAPSYYEKLYALVKPVLPAEIIDVIHFFTDYESLHQFVDKKYLPVEYGGEAQSMYEQNQEWRKKFDRERKFFLDDNVWKADTKKISKIANNTMSGSFRTLSID
ncbi:unnamed protein product, partial [Brenthis ino]